MTFNCKFMLPKNGMLLGLVRGVLALPRSLAALVGVAFARLGAASASQGSSLRARELLHGTEADLFSRTGK